MLHEKQNVYIYLHRSKTVRFNNNTIHKKNKHHRQPLIGVFCNTLIQTLSMYNILACSYIHNNKSLTYIISTVSIKSSELSLIIHVIIRVIAHYSLDYIMLNIAKNTLKLGCTSYKVLSVL